MSRRLVIIGIDGVPFRLIEDLSDRDVMPNFKELRKNGIFTKMESTIPEISSASWSSIITGENPGEHGVFGFTDLIPGTYTISFPNFRNLKSPAFWQTEKNKKHVIINVPSTYPASEINGFIVSGFVSLDLEKAVQPKSYVKDLDEMGYKIDVDSKKAHKSIMAFLKDLKATHKKRVELYRKMWDKIKWDNFMFVLTGSDRLEHFLWNAYEDKDHEYHDDFLEYFRSADEVIGEIYHRLSEDDRLIMLSDHGMEQIKTNVNLNTYLEKNGFLKTGDKPSKRYNNISDKTKAFALDPSRIYLNKKGKYPKGYVQKEQEQSVIEELVDLFSNLKKNGDKVIKKIYKKDEIYKGKNIDQAPDLVLLPNHGYSLRGSIGKEEIFEIDDKIVGMHTQPDAFLYVMNKGENLEKATSHPKVEDVATIMNIIRNE